MLIVTGGMTANTRDRELSRDEIHPVQYLNGEQFAPIVAFDSVGELGVSNIVEWNDDLVTATQTSLLFSGDRPDIHDLHDVHEISVIDEDLWIANTGRNEAVRIDPGGKVERFSFGEGEHHHVNQLFKALDGTICGLVHHVEGRQIRTRVANRLLKRQGDGGLVSVDGSAGWPLSLTAPHNVRIVGDEHWVLDSGRARICRFDETWQPISEIQVGGWGRGAATSADGTVVYVGLSPIRKRYKEHLRGPAVDRTEVHVIDTQTRSVISRIPVDNIDQINGVHLIDDHLLENALVNQNPQP